MPYIGNPPAERFTSFAYQDLTGGSGTSFTLDNAVGNPQEIEVFVNNVRQEPGVAYTVSGTALTMTGSIATTDDFYVVFQGKAIQTATHPSDRALTATDGTFTGDVGIGTSTVDSALHIEQNASGVTETSGSTVKIHNTNSSGRSKITLHNSAETASGSIFYDTDSGGLALQGDTGAIVAIHTNGNNERLRVDTSGHVGVGTTTPSTYTAFVSGSTSPGLVVAGTQPCLVLSDTDVSGSSSTAGITKSGDSTLINNLGGGNLDFYNNGSFRMRLDSSGNLIVAHTSADFTVASVGIVDGNTNHKYLYSAHTSTNTDESVLYLNRQSSDGRIVDIRQANTIEGSISVSGSTVSFNGGHLTRWSRLTDNAKPTTLLKGTVMSNLDQMVVWHREAQPATYYEEGDELPDGVSVGDEKTAAVAAYDEDNEQLNCTVVSDTEGDVNVAGVFVGWDSEDDYNDFYLGMTGDMVIRIAQGTTVARGDLLMSAGDGTAKPQGDDIVRSKTIAKVTSITKSHTYDDGSYLVPCVLMAC